MTETEWLSTETNAKDMFRHVRAKLSARKLQLLGCACCRLIDPHLSARQRENLSVIERYADGAAERDEYQRVFDECKDQVHDLARSAHFDPPPGEPPAITGEAETVIHAMWGLVCEPLDAGLDRTVEWVIACEGRSSGTGMFRQGQLLAQRRICPVFREIVGNPFRERTIVRPEWVQSGGAVAPWMLRVSETARALAVGIQATQAYDRMPILADALEDDGCADAELLVHLRENRPHVRGCWALDLVLGKS
jgi:hypothetical protein